MCPNTTCINNSKLVFGKHVACPKCGTARNAKMPGDWRCPNMSCVNSKNTVFASKVACPKCGAPRPGSAAMGMIQTMMPQMQMGPHGDWQCPNMNCVNHVKMVFGKNASCQKCGSQKPAGGALGGAFGGFGQGNLGDWQCPNAGCINHTKMVFAKNAACPQCGSPKPAGSATLSGTLGGFGASMQGGNGDWQCPNAGCINNSKMVFGKHASCQQCGTAKPAGGPHLGALGALMQGMGMNMGGMSNGRGGSNPGDWRCPNTDCMNHRSNVFAKHAACPKCGSEKPMGYDVGGADRSRSPHRTAQVWY